MCINIKFVTLTSVMQGQQTEPNPMQATHQAGAQTILAEKCKQKEEGREQVLAAKQLLPSAKNSWVEEAIRVKSKQKAVSTMMEATKGKQTTGKVKEKKKTAQKKQKKKHQLNARNLKKLRHHSHCLSKPRNNHPTKTAIGWTPSSICVVADMET